MFYIIITNSEDLFTHIVAKLVSTVASVVSFYASVVAFVVSFVAVVLPSTGVPKQV